MNLYRGSCPLRVFICQVAMLFYFLPASVWAVSLPRPSPYDSRMQQVDYNAANTTVVNATLGFLTTIVFNRDETVLAARSGFESGWDVSIEGNKVFISPRPAAQEQEIINESGVKERVTKLFEPSPAEWKTNLFVTTNKRDYSLELNLFRSGDTKRSPAFVVSYQYPEEIRERDKQLQLAHAQTMKAAQDKSDIAQKLEAGQAPRNWDYFMRVGKESQTITPDFAYDDGERTYLGFVPHKIFPSAFLYINGQEQVVNMSSRQKGNYKIMVIHSLSNHFVLRYGDQVVGIVNGSFGKFAAPFKTTSSAEVERVEVAND